MSSSSERSGGAAADRYDSRRDGPNHTPGEAGPRTAQCPPTTFRWVLLLLVVVLPPIPARAGGVAALSALKAAYTFHFLNLVQWEGERARRTLCVIGDSEAGDQMLDTLENKTVHGLTIHVRRLSSDSATRPRCDALYIPGSSAASAATLLKRFRDSTLMISDIPHFVEDGGVIGFVVVGDRLRFDVNQRAAKNRRLKISAKLLELAREVVR
jgi:hypothetical protein